VSRSDTKGGVLPRPEISEDLEGNIAEAIFSEFGGESKAWKYLISRARRCDARLTFDILRYWTDRKYGKPSQRVEAQVDVGLSGLAERISEVRKRRREAEERGRLLPKEIERA
jgi:hypothetical protein